MDRTPPVVEVEWDDHTSQDGAARAELSKMVTIGYLVEDTEDHVTVSRSWVEGKPYDQQFVDKRMLTRKRVVRR